MKKSKITIILIILISVFTTSCDLGYKVGSDKVTFTYWNAGMGIATRTFEVEAADPSTFKILNHARYALDKNHCYYKGKLIPQADPNSFTTLLEYYAKDDFCAYHGGDRIIGADGKSFEVIEKGPYSRDEIDYFFDTTKLNVSDYSSFQILNQVDEHGRWAKDKTHYYLLYKKFPLSDYESFEVLGNGYAKDKHRVYFKSTFLVEAEPKTFRPIESQYGYGRDKNGIYNGLKKLPVKDLDSYEVISNGYVKDKYNVYYGNMVIENANPAIFEVFTWPWSRDGESYFYQGKKVNEIDYSTFKVLGHGYSIDEKNVYYENEIIEDADTKTFEYIQGSQDGKDKSRCYSRGKVVPCNKI